MNQRRPAGSRPALSGIEVSGGNILAMLAAMGSFRHLGEQLLSEHGIDEVTAQAWYPLPAFVAALESISHRVGPHTMFQIGRLIPEHVMLPARIKTFEDVCAAMGAAFDLNHRGGDAGGVGYRITGKRSALIITSSPYPCDFDRGVIQGFSQRFLGSRVTVAHDPDRACKALGGPCCTYIVRL